jgi:hypothetical protein
MTPWDSQCLATIAELSIIPKSSLSPFGEFIYGALKIEVFLVLGMDEKQVQEFMRTQCMMPAPCGKYYDWRRLLINIMWSDRKAGRG